LCFLGALFAVHDLKCLSGMADGDGHQAAGQPSGISAYSGFTSDISDPGLRLPSLPRPPLGGQGWGWGGVGECEVRETGVRDWARGQGRTRRRDRHGPPEK